MLALMNGTNDKSNQSLSFAIISAVAEQEGVDITDIEPPKYESLYSVLNPEALDALFKARENGMERSNGYVEFEYCDYSIRVTSDGDVSMVD